MKTIKEVFKQSYKLTLAFTLLFLPFLTLSLYSDVLSVRYNEDRCIGTVVEDLSNNKTTVAIAFVGSSRSMAAIRPEQNHSAAEYIGSGTDVIFDASRSHRGMGHNFIIARDIIEQAEVKNLVVEINNSRPKHHRNFFQKAKMSDIFSALIFNLANYNFSEVAVTAEMIAKRLADRAGLVARSITENNRSKKLKHSNLIDCSPSKDYVEPGKFKKNKDRFKSLEQYLTKKAKPIDFKRNENKRMLYYVNNLINVAEQNGVCLHFIFVPGYYGNFISDKSSKEFFALTGKRIHQLPIDKLTRLFETPLSFFDTLHLAKNGSIIFEEWLYDQLPLCK